MCGDGKLCVVRYIKKISSSLWRRSMTLEWSMKCQLYMQWRNVESYAITTAEGNTSEIMGGMVHSTITIVLH